MLAAPEAGTESRDPPSIRCQPRGDIGDNGWVNVLCRFVFRGRGWTRAGEEEMVVGVVDTDRDIGALTDARLPSREIILDRHLTVAATLEDEHWSIQRRRSRNR